MDISTPKDLRDLLEPIALALIEGRSGKTSKELDCSGVVLCMLIAVLHPGQSSNLQSLADRAYAIGRRAALETTGFDIDTIVTAAGKGN